MTDTLTEADMHLTDGEIVRFLDAEADEAEREKAESHLSSCLVCRRKHANLRGWSEIVSEGLRELDREPGLTGDPGVTGITPLPTAAPRDLASARSGGMPSWLRVAAVVVLLAGFVATLTPDLRAWVADQWTELVTLVAGTEEPVEVMELPADPAPVTSARVAFPVQVDVFRIEVEGTPGGSRIMIDVHAEGRAIAEVVGGAGREELVVLPDGLRIRDAGSDDVLYRLLIPDHLQSVEIRIPDRPLVRVSGAEVARGGVAIDLGTRVP